MSASDSHASSVAQPATAVPVRSLWVRAALAIAVALAGNVVVWWLATTLLAIPPDFPPLDGPGPAIFFTVVGMVAAVIAWRIVISFSATPAKTYRRVALVALLLSFVPDFMLLTEGAAAAVPGVTLAGVVVLMIMHLVAAAAAVRFLPPDRGTSS